MAKRKQARPWDAVFDQIQVRPRPRLPEYVYPAPVTDVELDELEAHLKCRVPESYRTFMKRFGPGEAADLIRLPPLGVRDEGNHTLIADTNAYRDKFLNLRPEYLPPKADAAWLGRLVYFGSDFCGDAYAWDPKDFTHKGVNECRVYRLRRMQEGDPEDHGETLADLIQGVWAEHVRLVEADGDEKPTGIDFAPWGPVREKVKPDRDDVKRWFAFNNNAARDLAFSIRYHGATDTFPILADALEEAGCTNADLLNSCRTGDPATDGVGAPGARPHFWSPLIPHLKRAHPQ